MKDYSIEAYFPQVKPAHAADQSCTIRATGIGVALARAWRELKKRPELKGKRIKTVKFTLTEIGRVAER